MDKKIKRNLIWIFSIIGIGILGYVGLRSYIISSLSVLSGCGMNDGPFTAVLTDQIKISEDSKKFKLNDNRVLILDNRADSLSPILMLKENEIVKWTLDTDTRNTKGYESDRIWEITNLSITENANLINLEFIAYWTFGAEAGWMEINRENGENSFCLSW